MIEGGDGDDLLEGGASDDTLYGGEGDDTLVASAFADRDNEAVDPRANLINDGTDALFGGDGDDTLYMTNRDTGSGGAGGDIFNVEVVVGVPPPVIVEFNFDAGDRLGLRELNSASDITDPFEFVESDDGLSVELRRENNPVLVRFLKHDNLSLGTTDDIRQGFL